MARSALIAALERQLHRLPRQSAVGIAVSGGPDSFALAVLGSEVAQGLQLLPYFFHVHHGLQSIADQWAHTVGKLGKQLQTPVIVRHVQVDERSGEGIEAAAREARYAALSVMAAEAGATHILLGHHQDDQVETVMLRLLRGAGLEGVAGMQECAQRDGIMYVRPWLRIPRSRLVAVAKRESSALGLPLADDPTNVDSRFARGVLRTELFPVIARHWPGYRATLERFARLAGDASNVLDEVAREDLERLSQFHPGYGHALDRKAWRELTASRRALVLRAWFARHDVQMPSEARLAALCSQLANARPDRQVLLRHGGCTIRVYRDRVVLISADHIRGQSQTSEAKREDAPVLTRSWEGEARWKLDEFAGTLYFDTIEAGIDPCWLKAQPLQVGYRRGRERLRLHAEGPSKTLKNLYQEAGIPAWERSRLPLVWRSASLIFAAGLGTDARAPQSQPGIRLRWQADNPGASRTDLADSGPNDNHPMNAG